MITLKEYQKAALRTAPDKIVSSVQLGLQAAALGLAGESGEFADLVKKVYFHDHPLDYTKLEKELGDVLWYCALAANALGTDLDRIATANIDKLKERYPAGFDSQISQARYEHERD